MAKRLFAMLLVLALVLSFMPVISVGVAAETDLDKHTSHDGWTEWTDSTKLPTAAGKYYLSVDVNLAGGWYPSTEIHLCLNGHNITQKTAGQRVLGVQNGGVVSVYDCTGTTDENGIYTAGKMTGGSQTIGAGVNVNRGGVFNLYGGKITGNHKAGTNGGGVYLQAATSAGKTAGMFNMYGGQICGNSAKMGAGVYVAGGLAGSEYTNAVFNMYGGIIGGYGAGEANVAETDGGAIYATTYGAVNIQGGKIVGNKAKTGAGLWAGTNITVNVENAEFTGNEAASVSAIYIQNNVQLTIKNTTVTGNTATNNSAEGYGTAVYATGAASKVTLSGKVYIAGNTVGNAEIADVFYNSTNTPAIEKLYVENLTGGYVKFGVKDNAANVAEASDVVAFEGAASAFSTGAISYMAGTTEKHVGLVDGAFKFVDGHFHEGVEYLPWTETTKLPDADADGVGYYLVNDVKPSSRTNAATVEKGATLHLCLNGKTIDGGNNINVMEAIRVADGSAYIVDCTTVYDENGLFVSGGKIINGLRKGNGAAVYVNNAASVLEITGIEISNNKSTETSDGYGGGAIQARKNTTPVKIVGCKFANNVSDGDGGAMALRENGRIDVEKTIFENNTAAKKGGAIYATSGHVNLKDCVFTGNSASSSGAINITMASTSTVEGCTFTGNTSNDVTCIGILGTTKITIKDSTFTGNPSKGSWYGAVNLSNGDAVVKLEGKVIIKDNLNKEGKPVNLHLQDGDTKDFDFSGLGAGSEIGVTLHNKRVDAGEMFFSTTGMTAVPAGVTSDNDTYEVYVDDQGRLALKEKTGGTEPPVEPPVVQGHTHKLCNDSACTSHGEAITFEAWDKTDSLPTAGNYYLTANVTLTAAVETTGDLNLCLNGKTVTAPSGKRILGTKIGTTTSVTDCGTTGQLTGGTATYGSAISVRHNSTFNLYAGKITGNSSTSEGTIYIQGGKIDGSTNQPIAGTFNMYGGEISGNQTKMGGAVSAAAPVGAVTQNPTINIYGGKISGNTTTDRGGAINVSGIANIYIENAEISGNTTGGDGTIYAKSGSTVTIKNAKIKNNNAKNGAAMSVYGGTLTLDGAVIQNNHSTGGYSAVHPAVSADVGAPTVILKGATVITGNTNGDANAAMNLFLRNNVMVDVSGLTDAAKIGLYRQADRTQDRVSTAAITEAELLRFESDKDTHYVDRDAEGYLILIEVPVVPDHLHKLCNDTACADHADVAYSKWTQTNSLPTSGKYYLTNDVELSAVVQLTGDLTLCLNGHKITQKANARVFYVTSGKTLTITDCATAYDGANYVGGQIVGGVNDTGASIFILEGSTFNLYAGRITESRPASADKASAGSAVFLRSTNGPGATFNMYGGEITGNGNEYSWGGAISNGSGNKNNTVYVNIYGGKIFDNAAGTGGAIRMENKSVTTIYGGEICDNTANTNGGAIFLSQGAPELVIKGGTIENNTANANGGAIFVTAGAEVTLEGAPVIAGNSAAGKVNNLYLAGAEVISLGTLDAAANIGISTATTNRAFTTETSDFSANFTPDNSRMTVSFKENKLWLEKLETYDHFHCICDGVVNNVCDHTQQQWVKWGDDAEEIGTLPTAGTYYLTQDVELSAVVQLTGDLTLCLNGHTITQTASARVFYVTDDKTLTITDCATAYDGANYVGGQIVGGVSDTGASIFILEGATFNMFGGRITGSRPASADKASAGSAVFLRSTSGPDATFNMYGGEITDNGNEYSWGGAISNGSGNKNNTVYVNIYGGKIFGNTAGTGGAIRMENKSVTTIYGGEIFGNTAKTNGGAVYLSTGGSELIVKGGEISNNTAVLGGGVYVYTNSSLLLEGGEICGNTVTDSGAGVYATTRATLVIDGGEICDNEAAKNGGGIFATGTGTTITLNSGAVANNTAKNGAGLITQTRSVFTMNGGEIYGNHATDNGGGMYISTNTDFVMNGGVIHNNIAGGSGAGFYALRSRVTLDNGAQVVNNDAGNRAGAFASSGATVVLNKCTIKGNTAKEGGVAYINRTSAKVNGETVYYPAEVTINEGALITENKGQSNSGGLLIANDEVVVTMNGGEISKNEAANGAAVMTWRGSTFIMKGGKITGNKATSNAAVYVSTASTFKMEGGSISNNTAKTAAGVYFLRCQADLTGGSISNNTARHTSTWKNGKESKSGGTGGAIYISGATVNFRGTSVTGNYSTVNGGAIMMGRASYKENGVQKYDMVKVNVYGGLFSGNKTDGAGGVMLIQSEGTVVNVYGGTFTNNSAKNAGAIYVSTKTQFNMSGGSIVRNEASNSGGGIYFLNAKGNITGGQIHSNSAITSAGNMMVSGASPASEVVVKNIKFHDGTSKTAASVVVQSNSAHLIAENCDFYDNAASSSAGAVYVSTRAKADFTNCKFYNNAADYSAGALYMANFSKVTVTNCDFTENTSKDRGGAIFTSPGSELSITDTNFSKCQATLNGGAMIILATAYLTNVNVENCMAENGGAVATQPNNAGGAGVRDGVVVKNSEFRNNVASSQGGAFYIWKGRPLHLYDSKITGNEAGAEGGAIWAYEDVQIHGAQITGNASGGEGYAVYMNDANYDGHSYFTSRNKLSGDVIIRDNDGGNLWMGPDVAFAITADGLGEATHIEVVLDSGVVTQRILGAYHYEGENQAYTITYGDRSMTDPEFDPSLVPTENAGQEQDQAAKAAAQTKTKAGSSDTVLYIGIGVVVVALVALGVVIVIKKKKAGKPAEKASK